MWKESVLDKSSSYGGNSMSLPTIPDINPKITLDRCDTINMLLSAIAMEEISLSHILNAEGEKLQSFLKSHPKILKDYLKMNDSVNKTLRTVVQSQILLQFKLEDVISLSETSHCQPCSHCDHHCHDKCKGDCDSLLNNCTKCGKKHSSKKM